ncbi:MAG: tetratricopeptide repeat protein [Spirochaeta sp.]|jgi:putative GTP pyrophosphokinase|nr:tetratricopeptide repeat protein [Spirochaeta sp.]
MFRVTVPLPARRDLEIEYQHHAAVLEKALHELHRRLRVNLTTDAIRPDIKYRIKTFESLYEKVLRRAREQGQQEEIAITDLLGIRVVCPFVEDITEIERVIRAGFDVTEVERKGDSLSAAEFGYSSVHLLVQIPQDIRDGFHLSGRWVCEVQLRTILQDAWAEVEHELVYKAELTPLDTKLKRKLAALNANLTLSDIIFQEIRDYQRSMQSKLMRRRETFWSQLSGVPLTQAESDRLETDGDADTIQTGSDTIDGMLIQALHAHNQKEYAVALQLYTDILAYQPADHVSAILYTHRGMAHFALGDTAAAIDDFGATIAISPRTVKAYYYRGVVHESIEHPDQALSDFSRCLEFDPYHIDSRVARARLYWRLGDHDAARADCRMARDLEPDHPGVQSLCRDLGAREMENL